MSEGRFVAEDWIDRLAQALPGLAEAQQSFLEDYWRHNPRDRVVVNGKDETPFPLDDLCHVYFLARHSSTLGGEKYFAPLRAAMDPVRSILRSHPTLARVLGLIIGNDEFWVQILGRGSRTSLTDLIGGLMARADELPRDGLRSAAGELHAFLEAAWSGEASGVPGGLDTGYDTVLFHGLDVEEEIDIGGGFTMLPFELARAFVDERVLVDMAPDTARYRDWRLVGAVARPFRWQPQFRHRDDPREPDHDPPEPFERDVLEFLELLAVSHRVPIVCLAGVRECVSRSACLLLGQAHNHGSLQRGRPVHQFDPFASPPRLEAQALDEAKKALESRGVGQYGKLAPVVARLAEALARDGRFAAQDRILDVAIALEQMYELGGGEISHKMRTRASWLLGTDAESRLRVMTSVADFYGVRSEIVHNRKQRAPAERYRAAFDTGFDIAARTLFKLLGDGPPDDWEELVITGDRRGSAGPKS
ncbi:MAG: HEPN domain-containing protein [Gemmatimonadetes bacterium]|nr:HEPN domain-containing protein [Gemmatimonadota bacterium]